MAGSCQDAFKAARSLKALPFAKFEIGMIDIEISFGTIRSFTS